MVSLRTEQDRTLFFDLLPFDLGRIYGLDVRLKLYAVRDRSSTTPPASRCWPAPTAIVFVADSPAFPGSGKRAWCAT
ncbi:MAG: hypothetical protein Q9Q13_05410, partial [Acidobacteriota bacterium]|nr:hypothetical protein [Acidobacteriota bacterium]